MPSQVGFWELGVRRRTLEDNNEGTFADFLAHPVVDADDVLGRTGTVVCMCGHLEADGEAEKREREDDGEGKRIYINTRCSRCRNPQLNAVMKVSDFRVHMKALLLVSLAILRSVPDIAVLYPVLPSPQAPFLRYSPKPFSEDP